MQQRVRVFIDDGTFCPGFQFLPGGQLQPTVMALFQRALERQIPHNYFTVWMNTPSRSPAGTRPVDHLKKDPAPLLRAKITGTIQAPDGGHTPRHRIEFGRVSSAVETWN